MKSTFSPRPRGPARKRHVAAHPTAARPKIGRGARMERHRARRGGAVLVYFSLALVLLLGVCAIVIDEGYWFYRQAEMQKATDAAAMAGAGALISGVEATADSRATSDALRYAKVNGFDGTQPRVTVTPYNDKVAKTFRVTISEPYPTFFGQVLGKKQINIVTTGTASYNRPSQVLIPITGGNYGVNTGPINIGIYGPEQITNRGDLYSARYTTDSQGRIVPNPVARADGYSFAVTVPPTFSSPTATLQIYDADSMASGADATADGKVWDENGKDQYGLVGNGFGKIGSNATTITRYALYSDNGTPFDPSDDGPPIDTRDIGADAAYNQQWKDFFTWNPAQYRSQNAGANFRLQVQTISGSNENGFNVRVTRPGDTDQTFVNGGNGSNVNAIGDIPVNFGKTGTGEVSLGYVPPGATQVRVDHFDSDVGVTPGDRIQYSYSKNGSTSQTYYGNPLLGSAADNKTETDTINLSGYQGGIWKAIYKAGGSDNTTWKLTYDGPPTGSPGSIRLIQ